MADNEQAGMRQDEEDAPARGRLARTVDAVLAREETGSRIAGRAVEGRDWFGAIVAGLVVLTVLAFSYAFMIGSFSMDPATVWQILFAQIGGPVDESWTTNQLTVVLTIRFPRICLAILIGGALAVSGASYQTLFKNPMVSPDLLGVSAGAGFGAALAMLNDLGLVGTQASAFVGGICAVGITYLASRTLGRSNLTVLVLAGVVVSSFFQALISVVKTLADPYDVLPSITYWLMGSLAKSTNANLGVMLVITVVCLLALFAVRHKVNVLAAGEDEAETMGVNVRALKVVLIVTSTLLTVCAVSVAGIVGWVGLVVPHIARLVVGSDFAKLLPTSFLIGGLLLLVIDCLIRGPIGADLPLGVLTALIGTPVFLLLLNNVRKAW